MFHCQILSVHAAAYYIGWIMNIAAVNDWCFTIVYYYIFTIGIFTILLKMNIYTMNTINTHTHSIYRKAVSILYIYWIYF